MGEQGVRLLLMVGCHVIKAIVNGRLELIEGIEPGRVQGLFANETPQAFDEIQVSDDQH